MGELSRIRLDLHAAAKRRTATKGKLYGAAAKDNPAGSKRARHLQRKLCAETIEVAALRAQRATERARLDERQG